MGGSFAYTYTISTADELVGSVNIVNRTSEQIQDDFSGKTITRTADIDLSGYGASYDSGKGWQPIGNASNKSVRGTFDGNGKVISNLNIDRPFLGVT